MAKNISLADNMTVKWDYEGKKYCLHIQRDNGSESPRNDDNLAVMACFHQRYNLGDYKEVGNSPEEFWHQLVSEHVSNKEILAALEAGKLKGIRIAPNEENHELFDVYETYYLESLLGKTEPKECLEYEGLRKDGVVDFVFDDLTIGHCMTLMKPHAEWLPLWLYDHSGLTISCGARNYPYNDQWDSSQLGWVVILKKTIQRECWFEYILDENGKPIREQHVYEDGRITYGYKTRLLTEETWRARAIEIMKGEVETYDQYLTGDIYDYTLYVSESASEDNPDWEEIESCCWFYGDNGMENGLFDQVGRGLKESILENSFELGEAELCTRSYYTF